MVLRVAKTDSGGGGRCARFLLSLWDGGTYKVDLQDLMYIDREYFSAMMMVYDYLHKNNSQLEAHVSQADMNLIVAEWG